MSSDGYGRGQGTMEGRKLKNAPDGQRVHPHHASSEFDGINGTGPYLQSAASRLCYVQTQPSWRFVHGRCDGEADDSADQRYGIGGDQGDVPPRQSAVDNPQGKGPRDATSEKCVYCVWCSLRVLRIRCYLRAACSASCLTLSRVAARSYVINTTCTKPGYV